jgi:hypothetical protein
LPLQPKQIAQPFLSFVSVDADQEKRFWTIVGPWAVDLKYFTPVSKAVYPHDVIVEPRLQRSSRPPLSLVPDWSAGLFLVGGGLVGGRDWRAGRPYQIAAWAFMVSLLVSSSLGNFQHWAIHSPEATGATGLVSISAGPYTAIVGAVRGRARQPGRFAAGSRLAAAPRSP